LHFKAWINHLKTWLPNSLSGNAGSATLGSSTEGFLGSEGELCVFEEVSGLRKKFYGEEKQEGRRKKGGLAQIATKERSSPNKE